MVTTVVLIYSLTFMAIATKLQYRFFPLPILKSQADENKGRRLQEGKGPNIVQGQGQVGKSKARCKLKKKKKKIQLYFWKIINIFPTCIINSISITKDNLLYFLDVIKFLGSAILEERCFSVVQKKSWTEWNWWKI